MPNSIELSDLLEQLRSRIQDDILVGVPARVESYDPDTTTATVTPLLRRPGENQDGETVYEDLPSLSTVPVAFQRGGGYIMQFDLSEGDTGVLQLLGLSLGTWFATDRISNPEDTGRHGLVAPVFIPGLVAQAQSLGSTGGAMVVGEIGGAIVHINGGVVRIGSSGASEQLVLGNTLTTWLLGHVHPVVGGPPSPAIPVAPFTDLTTGQHLSPHLVDD